MPFSYLPCLAAIALAALVVSPARADLTTDLAKLHERRLTQLAKVPASGAVDKILSMAKVDGSFSDLDYADTIVNDAWQPKDHLVRLNTLVGAYLSSGPDHRSNRLKDAVLRGTGWWLSHDLQNKNWFWNQIGVPTQLAPSLLVFWNDLTADQKAAALKILGRAKIEQTGTNLIWLSRVVIDRGLLTGNAASVEKAFAAITADIKPATKQQDGAQPDNSFLYHGPLLYTWGYGIAYLSEQAELAAFVADTGFAMPKEKIARLRDWTIDGAQWLARGSAADFGGEGREIARKGQTASALIDIGQNLLKVAPGREDELRAMIARTQGQVDAEPLVGNRQFWRADIMAHQRPGWYASARMYSSRTKNTESINGEALRNFYIADGANALMRDGQEYKDLYPVWDWQHVPGTTVELLPGFGPTAGKTDAAPAGFVPSRNDISRSTKESFVGGVSDGQYGAFGGRFSRDALSVRRGWFFFDDQYVCLLSGLTCTSGNPVITTLDQSRLRGPVTAADGVAVTVYGRPGDGSDTGRGDHQLTAAHWLLHGDPSGHGVGYIFADPRAVRFTNRAQSGSWHDISIAYPNTPESHDVFCAWIEHGSNASNASMAYTVYPTTDAKALAEAGASPPVTVVANTADCQAVWHAGLGRGGAIFFAAGDVTLRPGLSVTVDQPCMILLSTAGGAMRATVSNPENRPTAIRLTIRQGNQTATLTVDLPGGGDAGSSVTCVVKL